MNAWQWWKQGFDAWEDATARYAEKVLQSPLVLGPSGAALSAALRSKAEMDRAMAQAWARVGLPTRRDQERMLYGVGQIQSRLSDLEEQLAEARAELAALATARTPVAPVAPAPPHPESTAHTSARRARPARK